LFRRAVSQKTTLHTIARFEWLMKLQLPEVGNGKIVALDTFFYN